MIESKLIGQRKPVGSLPGAKFRYEFHWRARKPQSRVSRIVAPQYTATVQRPDGRVSLLEFSNRSEWEGTRNKVRAAIARYHSRRDTKVKGCDCNRCIA